MLTLIWFLMKFSLTSYDRGKLKNSTILCTQMADFAWSVTIVHNSSTIQSCYTLSTYIITVICYIDFSIIYCFSFYILCMIDEKGRKLQQQVSVNSNSFFLLIMIHKLPNAIKHDWLTNEIYYCCALIQVANYKLLTMVV